MKSNEYKPVQVIFQRQEVNTYYNPNYSHASKPFKSANMSIPRVIAVSKKGNPIGEIKQSIDQLIAPLIKPKVNPAAEGEAATPASDESTTDGSTSPGAPAAASSEKPYELVLLNENASYCFHGARCAVCDGEGCVMEKWLQARAEIAAQENAPPVKYEATPVSAANSYAAMAKGASADEEITETQGEEESEGVPSSSPSVPAKQPVEIDWETALQPERGTGYSSSELSISVRFPVENTSCFAKDLVKFVTASGESESAVGAAKPGQITLNDCLQAFTTEEILSEEDPWYCSNCKQHRQASKKFDLWRLPQVLVIHLKRFSYTRYSRDKISTFVDFPFEGLDLSPFTVNPEHSSQKYDLFAISNHMGGLGGGHYTAYVKNLYSGTWFTHDDSSVYPVKNISEIKSSAAYVLFYVRREESLKSYWGGDVSSSSSIPQSISETPVDSNSDDPSSPGAPSSEDSEVDRVTAHLEQTHMDTVGESNDLVPISSVTDVGKSSEMIAEQRQARIIAQQLDDANVALETVDVEGVD